MIRYKSEEQKLHSNSNHFALSSISSTNTPAMMGRFDMASTPLCLHIVCKHFLVTFSHR